MPHISTLPDNASDRESALHQAADPLVRHEADVSAATTALAVAPPQFLAHKVWQLGLSPLTPYVPGLYALLSQGRVWRARRRNTPSAVPQALGWLGYAASTEEAKPTRRRWNGVQLQLDRVRDADTPDLKRIAGAVNLGLPMRSDLTRVYHGYDVRICEAGASRWGAAIWGSDSGTRLDGVAARYGSTPLWSFGREHVSDGTLTQAELTGLGTWIAPVTSSPLWEDADYLWEEADFPWDAETPTGARAKAIALSIAARQAYVRFRDASGVIIGHCRALSHPVSWAANGAYTVGSDRWAVNAAQPTASLIFCRTGFGDGAGATAASMSLVFDPVRAAGVKPGQRWVPADGLSGGIEAAPRSLSIPFGLTVREHCTYLLRF